MPNNSFLAQEVWEGAGTPHIHQSLVPPGLPPRCREPGASSANTAGVQGSWKPEPHCFVWGGPHPRAWGAGAAGSWTPTAQLWEWGPDATLQGRRQAALLVHPPALGRLLPGDLGPPSSFGDLFCPLPPPSPILFLFCPWPPRREQRHSSGVPRGDHESGQPARWALPWKRFDQPCSAGLPPSEPRWGAGIRSCLP